MTRGLGAIIAICWLIVPDPALSAQQVPDSAFTWRSAHPAYAPGKGPVIAIDAAHNNVHVADGHFGAFARLVQGDGYRVQSLSSQANDVSLRGTTILVIASPRHPATLRSRRRPILEALTDDEIAHLVEWVERGGSLLLISDHMPIAGSMQRLAAAFGFHLVDGFAAAAGDSTARQLLLFGRGDGTLADGPISNGRSAGERVDSIATFTGAAFTADPGAEAVLRLPSTTTVLIPEEAWRFDSATTARSGAGLLQGAVRRQGRGRVALFAEAAMFTAQHEGAARTPMGMNHPAAAGNPQLVLNLVHWLSDSR